MGNPAAHGIMHAHLRPRECQPNGMTGTDAQIAPAGNGCRLPGPLVLQPSSPPVLQPSTLPNLNPSQPDTSHLVSARKSLAKYFHNNLYGTTRKIEKSAAEASSRNGQNCFAKKGKNTETRRRTHGLSEWGSWCGKWPGLGGCLNKMGSSGVPGGWWRRHSVICLLFLLLGALHVVAFL